MLTYAEEVAIDTKQVSDGESTFGAHLRQLEKTRKKKEDDSNDEPPKVKFPLELEYLWGVFLSLSERRNYDAWIGLLPIRYADIYAYCRLYKMPLESWEIKVIEQLDSVWMRIKNERPRGTQSGNKVRSTGLRQ